MEEKLGEAKVWPLIHLQQGSYSPHMLKGEGSLSEEPTFYLETCKLKGSMKCYLKPEGQSSKTGKNNTNPKMGQDN